MDMRQVVMQGVTPQQIVASPAGTRARTTRAVKPTSSTLTDRVI
ncbi:hypothetical protein K788_0000220 [Paraburkholderia caribensis MBA4]|uniref:Uncharacterized protein n=1 Tax=Paraburkholderia caribensis MBA4 TaxID=1323664 RepID=A0A0P0RJ93_9BURK|nr:hypothetical protein K788_0000220 [Paraburkholderia caribensis MBA4]